jgi:hypothetical protein
MKSIKNGRGTTNLQAEGPLVVGTLIAEINPPFTFAHIVLRESPQRKATSFRL